MPDYIGSYSPLIHFPHDSWIKLAAIYWDKLGRIVPVDYPLHDSDTGQKVQGELVLSTEQHRKRSEFMPPKRGQPELRIL
jgi:hypothetical protein